MRWRLAPAEGGLRALQQQVLRSFTTTGRPPAASALAETAALYGTKADAVLAGLHAADFLRLSPGGEIRAAYPFSAAPTPHMVDIDDGPQVHAMCAIDALGIAAMLGPDVMISSVNPRTGYRDRSCPRADRRVAADGRGGLLRPAHRLRAG